MKKKFIAIVLMILTCAALAFGFTACGGGNDDIPADGNMAKVVLREGDRGLLAYYAPTGAVTGWGAEFVNNYALDDIIGTNLPYKNYNTIEMRWKTGGYKITKIEFDLTVQNSFKSTLKVINYNSTTYEKYVNLAAGQTQHIIFNVDLSNNSYDINVFFGANADAVMRLVDVKISNFYVAAEKI